MTSGSLLRSKLAQLAGNLWWTWNTDVIELFRALDPGGWHRSNHNPLVFLETLGDGRLEERARSLNLETRILAATRRLQEYLESRDTWGARHAGLLRVHPVAYFCAEFGLHESLPLYSGGLGVLAGDHLKSASDLGIPLCGVGIFYAQGYFKQHLDSSFWQQEEFLHHDTDTLPLETLLLPDGTPRTVEIPAGEALVLARVRLANVGRCSLYLLDADVDGNPPEYRELTHRLYWGDETSRIRQELVLGVGGRRLLQDLGISPGVLHMNEGHSAFALLESIRLQMELNGVGFDEAAHRVGTQAVFTTHTPVPAGHDRFPPELVEQHLGWLREALGLSRGDFLGLGRTKDGDDGETFCMTVLAMKLARGINGVSSIHGRVSRRMWKKLWPGLRAHEVPIGHVTNGVHTRSWVAPQVDNLLRRHLGDGWHAHLASEQLWGRIRNVRDDEIWEIHEILRGRLVEFARQSVADQEGRRGVSAEEIEARTRDLLHPRALTIGFARRFATYKRATLLLDRKDELAALVADPERPVQLLFAGKAHPRDDAGKALVQQIAALQREGPFRNRLVFLEDYDISVARHLVQGVDVWLNNPLRPEEACGTSGMKVLLSGGLNLSMLDGWWAEAYDGGNGFAVRSEGPHADAGVQRDRDVQSLLATLKDRVIPTFYERDGHGLPRAWISLMRQAFRTLAWRYSADRMVIDYAEGLYLPAAGGTSASVSRTR